MSTDARAIIRAVKGIVFDRPVEKSWKEWVATLKTGDAVYVCDYYTRTSIYWTRVRVTLTGKIYLSSSPRDRTDWGKNSVTSRPGSGERFIVPAPDAPPEES
jgi:hypothetical protein